MWERGIIQEQKINKIISESNESFGKNTQLCKVQLIGLVRKDDIELRSELGGGKSWDRKFQKENK